MIVERRTFLALLAGVIASPALSFDLPKADLSQRLRHGLVVNVSGETDNEEFLSNLMDHAAEHARTRLPKGVRFQVRTEEFDFGFKRGAAWDYQPEFANAVEWGLESGKFPYLTRQYVS